MQHTNTTADPMPTWSKSLIETPLKQIRPPYLATETLNRLRSSFAAKNHDPSPLMWDAIGDIALTLEQMAEGTAEHAVHLASLDCGVGKTQTVVNFIPTLLASPDHADVSTLVCAGRLDQIREFIADAKKAGLREEDYAVLTSDKADLNKRGLGEERKHRARVLFTTHAQVIKQCKGRSFVVVSEFHYCNRPREVRVWDEACHPGLAVTLNKADLSALIKPVSRFNAALADRMLDLLAELHGRKDGDQFTVPDLASLCGVELNDLEGIFDNAGQDLKIAANALWFLLGKPVTVRNDGKPGNAMLDYREALPHDIKPMLVLDASSRRDVRETYSLWEEGRGGIKRLREAPKDYSPATAHVWATSGGKTAFKDIEKARRLKQGIANTINGGPSGKWLVVHHKDPEFEANMRALLREGVDVQFIHWGAHEATNGYADRANVILAGTLFLRPSQYEAIGRAAAGLPSSQGPFPKAAFEAVRQGEHRHAILQAICRGMIRKCHGASCPPCNIYIIASRGSRIADDLPQLLPGCRVREWQPVPRKLSGKVAAAVSFIIEQTKDGAFVSDADVMKHIMVPDKSNYNRNIKKHDDLRDELADRGIVAARKGRVAGFQHSAAALFGGIEEHD